VNAQIHSTIGPCAVNTNMRASNCLISGIAKYTPYDPPDVSWMGCD
jgi:hypothetical protein